MPNIILLLTTEINVGHKFLNFKKTEQKKFCKSSKFFVEWRKEEIFSPRFFLQSSLSRFAI